MPTNCILAAALLTATALAALPAVEEKKADAAPRDVSIKVVDGAVEFRHGDALKQKDIGEATVVVMYMFPEFMDLWFPIAKEKLKPGTRIVSHDFGITEWPEDEKKDITVDFDRTLYLWVVK